MATAAAIAVGAFAGAAVLAGPAWAADGVKIVDLKQPPPGKPGDTVTVSFGVRNLSDKTTVTGLQVDIIAPSNATIQAADGCRIGLAGGQASCQGGSLGPGKTAQGEFTLVIKGAGNGTGRITVRDGLRPLDTAGFVVRATGPVASASASATKKPSKGPSGSVSDEPSLSDETLAPPVAGNGAIPQSDEAAPDRTSSGGGMSAGIWIGIVAIVGALGLVGSLFYFRRKDRDDPGTGMHPVVPAPAGGFGPPQPTTYGSPPPYEPVFPPPQDPYQAGGATQIVPPPPGNDPTITFQRPEQY